MKRQRHASDIRLFLTKRMVIARPVGILNFIITPFSQTEDRRSAQALIHIMHDFEITINFDRVCRLFLEKYPRRMEYAKLLF